MLNLPEKSSVYNSKNQFLRVRFGKLLSYPLARGWSDPTFGAAPPLMQMAMRTGVIEIKLIRLANAAKAAAVADL
jgi:hypothetical protein